MERSAKDYEFDMLSSKILKKMLNSFQTNHEKMMHGMLTSLQKKSDNIIDEAKKLKTDVIKNINDDHFFRYKNKTIKN